MILQNFIKFAIILFSSQSTIYGISGFGSKICHQKPISSSLRNQLKLSYYYQRSIEVNGILILGSNKASISSMKRACYILRFALAEQVESQRELINKNFRIVIMANNENLSNLPEFSNRFGLSIQQSRNLIAKTEMPIAAIGEELLTCTNQNDRLKKGEPLLNSIINSILTLNAMPVDLQNRLQTLYDRAKSKSKWLESVDYKDYFANGVEVYFNTKIISLANYDQALSNSVDLKNYDLDLHMFINELFFCNNTFLQCSNNKDEPLKSGMKCSPDFTFNISNTTPITSYINTTPFSTNEVIMKMKQNEPEKYTSATTLMQKVDSYFDCQDLNTNCESWFKKGECQRNPQFMAKECKKSCDLCYKTKTTQSITKWVTKVNSIDSSVYESYCRDEFSYCPSFASRGDCKTNPHHMLDKCKRSCNLCGDLNKPRDRTYATSSRSYRTSTSRIFSSTITTKRKQETNITSKSAITANTQKGNTTSKPQNTSKDNKQTPKCSDSVDYCPELAQRGDCQTNRETMIVYCSKSCKFC